MHFNIYDVFYSTNSQQHVSAGNPAILRAMLFYNIKIQVRLIVSPSRRCPTSTPHRRHTSPTL